MHARSPKSEPKPSLRETALLCPEVDRNSAATQFALQTIDDVTEMRSNAASRNVKIDDDDRSTTPRKSPPPTSKRVSSNGLSNQTKKRGKAISRIGTLLWILFLELPLVALFGIGLGANLLSHVYDEYLDPQFDLMTYTDDNRTRDATLYDRQCTPDDMTTNDSEDLIIQSDFTTQDCVDHMLTHGMSVYQSILQDETASEMRSWILQRNQNISKKDEITVLSNENRWSFKIGVNQHPVVTKALKEIATHKTFRPALEKIVGRNPAVIEMTAITSAFGAKDQFWHADTIPDGSPAKFVRSFLPSYSLFIAVQDITAAMGATAVCPGTHMCHSKDFDATCENGFQISGDKVLKRGNALLLNQQTAHRGPAHIDPNGEHRALFIVTFAPRQMDMSVESRMIGQGGSYSLRWDMWGHTLDDFEHASTKMTQPWAALRGLGLYKPKDAEWGWDFLTQHAMRISNGDTGYDETDFDNFEKRIGLPKLLSVDKSGDPSWTEFLERSVKYWADVALDMNIIVNLLYVGVVFTLGSLLSVLRMRSDSMLSPLKASVISILRVMVFDVMLVFLALGALRLMAESSWGKAIKSRTLYSSPFSYPERTVRSELNANLAVVSDADVIVTERFDDAMLGSLADIVNYLGGNPAFNSKIKGASLMFNHLNTEDKNRLVANVLDGMKREGSRFVLHDTSGDWVLVPDDSAAAYTLQTIHLASNPLLATLHKEARFLLSRYKHGRHYSGAMARKHSLLAITAMMNQLVGNQDVPNFTFYPVPELLRNFSVPTKSDSSKPESNFPLAPLQTVILPMRKKTTEPRFSPRVVSSIPVHIMVTKEPMLKLGDIVEVQYEGIHNEYYKGKIVDIGEGTKVDVRFEDGDMAYDQSLRHMTRFVSYTEGEIVEAKEFPDDDSYHICKIVKVYPDDMVLVEFDNSVGRYKIPHAFIRRVKQEQDLENNLGKGFKVGDDVLAPFQGSEEMYRGKIIKKNRDGTFNVLFDDGDVAENLSKRDFEEL